MTSNLQVCEPISIDFEDINVYHCYGYTEMSNTISTLQKNRKYSEQRIKLLLDSGEELAKDLSTMQSLSVFVCGSYGRLEANETSDIDLFLINVDTPSTVRLSNLDLHVFLGRLVETLRRFKFQELTDEGKYLEVHDFSEIREALGGDEDDYYNYFTTRMLLLLESRPIFNEKKYHELLSSMLDIYYEDYHDHEKEFRPVFLLNDLIRFFKTLGLNYEHNRRIKKIEAKGGDEKEKERSKAKVHLKNLKLKNSRLLTCYSLVIAIASMPEVKKDDIIELIKLTPLERLDQLDSKHSKVIREIESDYERFLCEIGRSDIIDLMADKSYRNTQFENARSIRGKLYNLLTESAKPTLLSYITM